jgi:hypothetical protein
MPRPELFHEIAGPDSAAARRRLAALGLMGRVELRNLHYPEAAADFAARGGKLLPAVWDGEKLHQGLEAALGALKRIAGG